LGFAGDVQFGGGRGGAVRPFAEEGGVAAVVAVDVRLAVREGARGAGGPCASGGVLGRWPVGPVGLLLRGCGDPGGAGVRYGGDGGGVRGERGGCAGAGFGGSCAGGP